MGAILEVNQQCGLHSQRQPHFDRFERPSKSAVWLISMRLRLLIQKD
jgi:hypothetical protein